MKSTDDSCDRRVLAALRRIVHAIDLHSRRLLLECDVTSPQLVCLHMLAAEGPLNSRTLADLVHVNPSTLVGILDRLEAKNLVCRRRDQKDRRSVSVELTREGAAFVAKAPSPLHAALAGRFKKLSLPHQKRLAESLEEVVSLMRAEKLDDLPVLSLARASKAKSGAS
ncbi:MAG: MarR family winged helix-turn-helix transcriptional regulator [Pirellulales bacterium]